MAKRLHYQSLALPLQPLSLAPALQTWGWDQPPLALPKVNRAKPRSTEAIPLYPYTAPPLPQAWSVESTKPFPRDSRPRTTIVTPTFPYDAPIQPPAGWVVESQLPARTRKKQPESSLSQPLSSYSTQPIITPQGFVSESYTPPKPKGWRAFVNCDVTPSYPFTTTFAPTPQGFVCYNEIGRTFPRRVQTTIDRPQGLPALGPMGFVSISEVGRTRKIKSVNDSLTPLTALTLSTNIAQAWGWLSTSESRIRTQKAGGTSDMVRPLLPISYVNWSLDLVTISGVSKKKYQGNAFLTSPITPDLRPISGFICDTSTYRKSKKQSTWETTNAFGPISTPVSYGSICVDGNIRSKKRIGTNDLLTPIGPLVVSPWGFTVESGPVAKVRRFVPEKATLTTPVYQWVFVPAGWISIIDTGVDTKRYLGSNNIWTPPVKYTTNVESFTFRSYYTDFRTGPIWTSEATEHEE